MNTSSFSIAAPAAAPGALRALWMRAAALTVTVSAIAVAIIGPAGAAPAVGDTYVYRVFNGYNNEARGNISYRVDKVDADRIAMSVTTDVPALGSARTVIYDKDGNWLRHPVTNHDQLIDYEFTHAYPAFLFPLDMGKSWSVRVNATNPAAGQRSSVRVDGEVLGSERISVPAGTFDTVKVRRQVYAGDWNGFLRETRITETDWYAPALGRPVRTESTSEWQDISRCARFGCPWFHGDWNVLELAATSTVKP